MATGNATATIRNRLYGIVAVLAILPITTAQPRAQTFSFRAPAPAPEPSSALWYDRPAGAWLEALPLGNGGLGAMVYGGVPAERIQLNDDTLWSGGPKNGDNPEALKVLPEIRRLILDGKFAEAHQLGKKMMGPCTQSYLPMGDLTLEFDHGDASEVRGYRRMLDLDRALAGARYEAGGVAYAREAFVSHPDGVLVVRLTAGRPGALRLKAKLGAGCASGRGPTAARWCSRGRRPRTSTRPTTGARIRSSTPPTRPERG